MPSKEAHVRAALENKKAIDYLGERVDDFPQWVVTIAFYKALHIVEAVFAGDPKSTQAHTDDHHSRNRVLKRDRRYEKLWRHYRPLYNDSLIARYLRDNDNQPTFDVFSQYLNPDDVRKKHLDHNLVQIVKTARTLLNDPEFLNDCVE